MKNRKLLVRVSCVTRDFYLCWPKGAAAWHIKFTPPRDVRDKLGIAERVIKSTGKTEIAPAIKVAQQIIEQHFDAEKIRKWEAGSRKLATVGEILERYTPLPQFVSARSVPKVKSCVRILIRDGLGIDPDKASADVFGSAELVKLFQRRRLESVRRLDYDAQQSAMVTINSTVRQAKSIFANEHMHLYDGLSLPDVTGFRAALPLKVERDPGFVPFAPGVIERIETGMREQPRNVFLTAFLMVRLGLRNCEVEHARWEWFSQWKANGTVIGCVEIKRRPYFKVKNQSVRVIQLEHEFIRELMPYWGAPDAWVIDAATAADRYDVTHRAVNVWLRTIITDRTKCAYELRKHAGSVILTRPESGVRALAEAAAFLGDTIQTTERVYARFLNQVNAVRAVELRSLPQVGDENERVA